MTGAIVVANVIQTLRLTRIRPLESPPPAWRPADAPRHHATARASSNAGRDSSVAWHLLIANLSVGASAVLVRRAFPLCDRRRPPSRCPLVDWLEDACYSSIEAARPRRGTIGAVAPSNARPQLLYPLSSCPNAMS